MGIRVCVWLIILLHMIAACSALTRTQVLAAEEPDYIAGSAEREQFWEDSYNQRYLYVHNETRIATARAEALHKGVSPLLSVHVPGTFPDFTSSTDGCYLQSALTNDRLLWVAPRNPWGTLNYDIVEILAVDSCARKSSIEIGFQEYELCSQGWAKKPDILIRSDNPRSFNVLVSLRQQRWRVEEQDMNEILAEGVYFPATGKMHLVGCFYKFEFSDSSWPPLYEDPNMTLDYSATPRATLLNDSYIERIMTMLSPSVDPDTGAHYARPLNSSTPEDCAISITLQFPVLHAHWNRDRVLRYEIRSKRERSDPLYFDPLERSVFFPYVKHFDVNREVDRQRRIEIWGRMVLLMVGLVCLALQIEHGRRNEEALPFVSLVMLGIQLTHHLSQTSIIKDLRVGAFQYSEYSDFSESDYPSLLQESKFDLYEMMAWSEHVPYQAMVTTAIFMYVWIFHRVGDRRRVMSWRVRRKRPGARDEPSEWRVLYATLAFFSLVCLLGFLAISADRHGHIRRPLAGTMDDPLDASRERWEIALPPDSLPLIRPNLSYFVPWQLYELWQARWRVINKLTGLAVSLFLVPQLLGNAQWEVQGRPLSAWFYAGIPLLRSVPHAFRIGQYFELLPIFSFYDPYFNSMVGIYEDAPDLWWHITVVVCSAAQVLIVHAQFLRSHFDPKSASGHVQTCDTL